MVSPLSALLNRHRPEFHHVVDFSPDHDRIATLDLREGGDLPVAVAQDTELFTRFVEELRNRKQARYLIGGYDELRFMYSRSELFAGDQEPRRLHLGTDIWAPAGTPVYAFMGGMVHSLAFNEGLGNYGATLILLHQLEGIPFYTLYGHISLTDISKVAPGQYITRGQRIAHFGHPAENGEWPPHLHFQVIGDMGSWEGDFPGVCRNSERLSWLSNCPDPDLILGLNQYIQKG